MFYESDKVMGMWYSEAVRFIERNDLWDEVAGLTADESGVVVAVWH